MQRWAVCYRGQIVEVVQIWPGNRHPAARDPWPPTRRVERSVLVPISWMGLSSLERLRSSLRHMPPVRLLQLDGSSYEFVHVALDFANDQREDVFAQKNNKTLRETLGHPRYSGLAKVCHAGYSQHLDSPLGQMLRQLKASGDPFYRRFLNAYGDQVYSTFAIADSAALAARGVYTYFSGADLMYIGRCKDAMKKRINQGYGKIHPKNCFRDGQATNCHLNALITAATTAVTLWLHIMDNAEEIETLEANLIAHYAPPWNIQRR